MAEPACPGVAARANAYCDDPCSASSDSRSLLGPARCPSGGSALISTSAVPGKSFLVTPGDPITTILRMRRWWERFKLFPNETDVVAAAGKAVDRSDRAIGSNALKGLFHLRISGIIITSNIEHFSLEPQTTRVRECGLIVELTSRIFRVCDASQYQHHLPRVVLFRRRRINRSR